MPRPTSPSDLSRRDPIRGPLSRPQAPTPLPACPPPPGTSAILRPRPSALDPEPRATWPLVPPAPEPHPKPRKADLLDIYRIMLCRAGSTTRRSSSSSRTRSSSRSPAPATKPSAPPRKVLRPAYDWFYLYYRDRALCLGLGMTPLDCSSRRSAPPATPLRRPPDAIALGLPGAQHRQHLSPTGTQFLHAVGGAEAAPLRPVDGDRGATTTSRRRSRALHHGDGTTSEGEFWKPSAPPQPKPPVVFLIEDNGYAISVPVEVNTPGGSISKLFDGLPRPAHPGSGRRPTPLPRFYTMVKAVDYARASEGPRAGARPRDPAVQLIRFPMTRSHYRSPAERSIGRGAGLLWIRFPKTSPTKQGVATSGGARSHQRQGGGGDSSRGRGGRWRLPQPSTDSVYQFVDPPDVDPHLVSSSTPRTIPASPAIRPPWWTCSTSASCDEIDAGPADRGFGEDVADCSREEKPRTR